MASIFKRGENWAFVMDFGKDNQGRRRRITKTGFKTKKDAEIALHETKQMHYQNRQQDIQKPSYEPLILLDEPQIKPRNLKEYRNIAITIARFDENNPAVKYFDNLIAEQGEYEEVPVDERQVLLLILNLANKEDVRRDD
jgi:hypothetical protein